MSVPPTKFLESEMEYRRREIFVLRMFAFNASDSLYLQVWENSTAFESRKVAGPACFTKGSGLLESWFQSSEVEQLLG